MARRDFPRSLLLDVVAAIGLLMLIWAAVLIGISYADNLAWPDLGDGRVLLGALGLVLLVLAKLVQLRAR